MQFSHKFFNQRQHIVMFARSSLRETYCSRKLNLFFSTYPPLSPQVRFVSSSVTSKVESSEQLPIPPHTTFARLSTPSLLRAVVLGAILKRSWLYSRGLKAMERLARSQSVLLDVDRNPFLRAIVRPLIYKQFCAGRDRQEIRDTIDSVKRMGYTGVILCYAREITVDKEDSAASQPEVSDDSIVENINAWREGNLKTLEAVNEGDYIGIKLTGADVSISTNIAAGKPLRDDFLDALDQVCQRAKAQGKYLWIDAEEQIYHPAIDNIAISLMRKYNTDEKVLVLNTIQAYLKSARRNLEWQLRLAQSEGWTLGVKLVRGAYIASETRSLIHDTKTDTDACYDGIVRDVLTRSWPNIEPKDFPAVRLFVAGHNRASIQKAYNIAADLSRADKLLRPVEFGQIQGMADDVGCELLDRCERDETDGKHCAKTFKCLTWGSVKECMHYLVRRAIENRGAAERLNTSHGEMVKELRRRLLLG